MPPIQPTIIARGVSLSNSHRWNRSRTHILCNWHRRLRTKAEISAWLHLTYYSLSPLLSPLYILQNACAPVDGPKTNVVPQIQDSDGRGEPGTCEDVDAENTG